MNSAITMLQVEVNNEPKQESRPAKLSQEKVGNIDRKYKKFRVMASEPVAANEVKSFSGRSFHAKDAETAEKLRTVGYTTAYKAFLDKVNIQIAQYGHAVVRLQGARKIKIVPALKEQTSNFRNASDEKANQISNDMNNNVANSITPTPVDDSRQLSASRVLATPEYNRSENVYNEPVSNINGMYNYSNGSMQTTPTRSEVNSQVAPSVNTVGNNLSRTARMDYNAGVMAKEEPKEVKQASVHPDIYSPTEYVQQKTAGNLKTSSDQDIARLEGDIKELDGEISEGQNIVEQLKAQHAEIQETKKQERISELEEEKLSKTQVLNGITEEIKALREAIRQAQQTPVDSVSYKR